MLTPPHGDPGVSRNASRPTRRISVVLVITLILTGVVFFRRLGERQDQETLKDLLSEPVLEVLANARAVEASLIRQTPLGQEWHGDPAKVDATLGPVAVDGDVSRELVRVLTDIKTYRSVQRVPSAQESCCLSSQVVTVA